MKVFSWNSWNEIKVSSLSWQHIVKFVALRTAETSSFKNSKFYKLTVQRNISKTFGHYLVHDKQLDFKYRRHVGLYSISLQKLHFTAIKI